MAEHFYGTISIPRSFYTDKIKELIDTEYKDRMEDEGDFITISDEQARYGQFEELEDFFIEHKVPFDRFSNSYDEYSAERRYYRPEGRFEGDVGDFTCYLDNYGDIVIEVEKLKPLLDKSPDDAISELKRLLDIADPWVSPLEDWNTISLD